MDKIKISMPIIVEGKYDKIKLDSIVDAVIITSEGFRIFKSQEKKALLKKLAEKSKLIVLADSDHAGMMIRSHIGSFMPKERIINLYTPQIQGKEKRKDKPSKEGFVGIEGVDADILRTLLAPFADGNAVKKHRQITKTDMYELGLSGSADSKSKRCKILKHLGLPCDISTNAMLEAINLLVGYDEFISIAENL